MDKRSLSERDICTKFITPALVAAGWNLHAQIREEVEFTDGRVQVRGQTTARGKRKRADYLLYFKPNIPLAVVEAKDYNHAVGDGMQQALGYSHPDCLDLPFAFSSNGGGFMVHDRTGTFPKTEFEIPLDQFPSPDELWERFRRWKKLKPSAEQIVTQDFHDDGSGKSPRYYQANAINRTIEAIARGQNRILLVMATGTGKTYTAFQIIWRLWKSGAKKRILFLADRNVLVDQTKTNDFKPFGSAMTKVRNRTADKAYEVYLALYQAITGPDESDKVFKKFSPDFFDLIVVDECHRGSADEDSAWREILDYFQSATQIGMTATPRETKYVSNIHYFGKAVYSYSLKQGIEDGFLAPYKVVRIDFDKDLQGWRPTAGQEDKHGQLIADRIYNRQDFDKEMVLEKRTELVAKKITEFLQGTNPFDKTIVFCEDIDHAERMRQALVNCNPKLCQADDRYVMRITGDNEEGKAQLDFFIDPESRYPVIATTSKLLSTGVDVKTCKVIALDKIIQSMTEFKQIIGRGTRIDEDHGKLFFTILDFKQATNNFADAKFDGDPVQIYEPGPDDPPVPPDGPSDGQPDDETGSSDSETGDGEDGDKSNGGESGGGGGSGGEPRKKYFVDKVPVYVVAERVQYYGSDGKLITESLRDYSKKQILAQFSSLNDFLQKWNSGEQKNAIVEEMEAQGVLFEALEDEVGKNLDPFDLVCHIAFERPPLTRRERANSVKKRNYFANYGDKARAVLDALLEKYADQGLAPILNIDVLRVQPIDQLGTPKEIIEWFGGKDRYLNAVKELEERLYHAA